MLGLLLLYWIGKYYYKLAELYNKNQWGFTILGIAAYYCGTFLFSLLIGIIMEIISPGLIDTFNETLFSVLMIPFGILTCYLVYIYLEKTWKSKHSPLINKINEIGERD